MPYKFLVLSLFSSASRICQLVNLGVEDELSATGIHEAVMVQLHGRAIITNWTIVHIVLDSVLWFSISVLNMVILYD
jgi:hypothetical protein